VLYRKRTETTELDPIATRQGSDDLIEDRVYNVLDIPLVEVRIVLGDTLDEFRFDHRDKDPGRYGYAFP
jgi:hypothetical protein